MVSERALLEFEDLRFKLARSKDRVEMWGLLDQMTSLLKEEIARTVDSLGTSRRDSRLGYRYEYDYLLTPDALEQKLESMREVLNDQIPAYKQRNGL